MEDDTKKVEAQEKESPVVVKDDNDSSQSIPKSPISNTTEEAKEKKIDLNETSPLKLKSSQHSLKTPEKEETQKDEDRTQSPNSPSTPQSKLSPEKKNICT